MNPVLLAPPADSALEIPEPPTQSVWPITDMGDTTLIVCSWCDNFHSIPKTTERGKPVPAICDPDLLMIVPKTLKPKSVAGAMRGREYDRQRKNKKYHERKEAKKQSSGVTLEFT